MSQLSHPIGFGLLRRFGFLFFERKIEFLVPRWVSNTRIGFVFANPLRIFSLPGVCHRSLYFCKSTVLPRFAPARRDRRRVGALNGDRYAHSGR
jgi:hypothetical protein